MTVECFAKVIDDPRINDIVIVDDASTDGSYELLKKLCSKKIRVYQSVHNVGMSRNKAAAIEQAKNPWCIIFDSDNIIGPDYLDAFFDSIKRFPTEEDGLPVNNVIFCPSFAKPAFDYRKYESFTANAGDCKKLIIDDTFNCLLNTCNYIVHRDNYLATYQYNQDHIASDTIWHNYNHLKNGGLFCVVPDMQYTHRVHPGSGFLQGIDHNMKMQNEVRKMIMAL
jgi:glycosyltransferase involved in cell wall biosynthesis